MQRETTPTLATQAGGVEGLPLQFSLMFSRLTKDCPSLGFLPAGVGVCQWSKGAFSWMASRRVASLILSQCLQVVLSDETWGGNFGGNWCRRGPWDYLCALEWAFGEQNMAGRLA